MFPNGFSQQDDSREDASSGKMHGDKDLFKGSSLHFTETLFLLLNAHLHFFLNFLCISLVCRDFSNVINWLQRSVQDYQIEYNDRNETVLLENSRS